MKRVFRRIRYGSQILQTVEQEKVARRSTPSVSMTLSEFLQRYNKNTSGNELYAITVLPAAMRADVGPIDRGTDSLAVSVPAFVS